MNLLSKRELNSPLAIYTNMRKFDHKDIVMLGGFLTIVTTIIVMIITSGITVWIDLKIQVLNS